MPFGIRKRGSKWVVLNTSTKGVKGTFTSKSKAQKQLSLLRGIKHGMKVRGR